MFLHDHMNLKFLAILLLPLVLASWLSTPLLTQAATNPEDECFDLLVKEAKNNPTFADLDLKKVKKINGRDGEFQSDNFSVATHKDFLKAFENEIPNGAADDIEYYPNQMNKVPNKYKFVRDVHKASRNNSASLIYTDGTSTPIDYAVEVNGKDYEQKIDGYYIDSRYVTFGRQSDLAFSFPNRDPNPGNTEFYPSGRPVQDMREYVMWTHHLAGPYKGTGKSDFVSCNILKMVPQSPYVLSAYDSGDQSINWNAYGATRMTESNARTEVVGGGDFRLGEIEYTTTVSNAPEKRLLRFYVLNLSYDNRSSFMNPFKTLGLFEEAMNDALNLSQTFDDMRMAFYDKVAASGLLIGADLAADAFVVNPDTPLAFGLHTVEECTSDGGILETVNDVFYMCRFKADTCPSDWKPYDGWSETKAKFCDAWGFCSSNDCTTKSHNFSDNPTIETCSYGCFNGSSCLATVTEVGCY